MRSTTRRVGTGLLKAPLSYGDQVLVGGIRGKILGGGWVDGVVQKQHPSGRVTVRIQGRNHVVSGKEVLPKRHSFTLRLPAELARPEDAEQAFASEPALLSHERWWVDEDEMSDENRFIVAVAAAPEDAELIARAPRVQEARAPRARDGGIPGTGHRAVEGRPGSSTRAGDSETGKGSTKSP